VTGSDRVQVVFEASYRRLVGQLYGVCGDLTEAEEVVAESFARAVQHQRTFARLDKPEAWLRTVAVNVSRTRFRRRQRIVPHEAAAAHPAMDDDRLVLIAAMRRLPTAQTPEPTISESPSPTEPSPKPGPGDLGSVALSAEEIRNHMAMLVSTRAWSRRRSDAGR
jgi:DNA-directed RNA polymerase specialized sigma24 family protein